MIYDVKIALNNKFIDWSYSVVKDICCWLYYLPKTVVITKLPKVFEHSIIPKRDIIGEIEQAWILENERFLTGIFSE